MPPTLPAVDDLPRLAAELETAPAGEILAWAAATYGAGLVFTSSFEDPVLLDLLARHAPATDVVLLDTQYHFAETRWYAEELRRRFDLRLTVVEPAPDVVPDNRWQTDVGACCAARKVEPLARALAGRSAWITGIRRVDAPTRADAPVVAYDVARGLAKINPLVTWSDDDVDRYITDHELPRHPLTERGYASIGCWPCTRPVAPGEDRRAGRWAGLDKTECGLHT